MTVVFKYLQDRVNAAARERAAGLRAPRGAFFYEELRLLEKEYSSDLGPLLKAIDEELCSSCSPSALEVESGALQIVNPDYGYIVWRDDIPF